MRARLHQENGASLVLVLMFMTVFGLIISGLLTEAGASSKFTVSVSEHEAKVYAADAGVQVGLQQLRQNNAICPRATVSGPPIKDIEVNGEAVAISCSVNFGGAFGADGFGVITRSTGADSLKLSNADAKRLRGNVWVSGGVDWGPGMNVDGGDFYHQSQSGSCIDPPPSVGDDDGTPTEKLVVDMPEYGYRCVDVTASSGYTVPDPLHVAPAAPTVSNPPYLTSGSCRVFQPGTYTAPPDLQTGDNYFQSGVYYFNFNAEWDIDHATVYGGQPASHEAAQQRLPLPSVCDDLGAGSGTGVLFVFGGNARMKVDTQAQVELFGRAGEAAPATSNMSLVAVPSGDSGWPVSSWNPSSLPAGTPVLEIKDGNQQDLAIHGLIYAPTADVVLTATNAVLAQAMGGLVANTLELKASASATGVSVGVAGGKRNPRNILVVACAGPRTSSVFDCENPGGEKPVRSSAVISITNTTPREITVESWRTRGPGDDT